MESIFICNNGVKDNWIMNIIAQDIKHVVEGLGYSCREGSHNDYQGEDICYHLYYHIAVPIKKAKHNSVFYTHLNDSLKEKNLVDIKDKFDSFICMSEEDVQFLVELGFDKSKVYGMTLPVRNTYIKPISLGMFSACYDDGRKNESWLIEYCNTHTLAQLANFVFVGHGWGRVVDALDKCGCSSEWHNVSRKLPYEYQFQQNKLANLDYYIYMGMDGGAMGTYDAYAQCVPLCITYDGYHKDLPYTDYTFDDKKGFFNQMDKILSMHNDRISFFREHSSSQYVSWLINVWHGKQGNFISDESKKCISYDNVLDKKRDQYYQLNYRRIRNVLSWKWYKLKLAQKK